MFWFDDKVVVTTDLFVNSSANIRNMIEKREDNK